MVLLAVEESVLRFDQVCGQEDVASEGGEEGVEFGGGGELEAWNWAWWVLVLVSRLGEGVLEELRGR